MARSINLGELPNGDLILASDEAFPSDVKRVEYYKSQKLFILIYENEAHESDLMHYELNDNVAAKVEKKSNLMIVEPNENGAPIGYFASLIQIGA